MTLFRKLAFFLWLPFPTLISSAEDCRTGQHYEISVERGVPTKMRDGMLLRADVYRPKSDDVFPVLLERTPYNKLSNSDVGYTAAARGYIVVIQDTRGRYTSDGEFYPFRYEAQDGYDTVEWAAKLAGSNGKVGMFGASYIGVTQMQAAISAPPHLSGIFPVVTASNYHDGWTYQGGAYEQWFNQTWGSGLVQDTLVRSMASKTMTAKDVMKLPLVNYPQIDLGLPVSFSPSAIGSYYKDWLQHPSYDEYWKAFSVEEKYDQIQVPAYHVAGVYDIFLLGTLRNFQGLRAGGGSTAARNEQRLELMMASHNRAGPQVGELDFGIAAKFNEVETMLRWYDYLLKGIDNGLSKEKPVKIFVMGRNSWRYEDKWPPERSHKVDYFLHSGGNANSQGGDGFLSENPPEQEKFDSYRYDPAHPVQTVGGALCCDESNLPGGPFDQSKIESRSDVLIYTTSPFNQEVDLIGPITFKLYASSSAVDTDFTAKLVDLWPNGFAQNLSDGIIRARYRNSQEKAEMMVPETVYSFSIDLVATSDALLPGHRLRVELSSSNFPRFDRNLNTGEARLDATNTVVATNKIFHDSIHKSALSVTIAPTTPETSTTEVSEPPCLRSK
jgi:putative CocE/NonD family hydrolase